MADGLDIVAVEIEHEGAVIIGMVMRAQARRVYTAGDIALLIVDWSVRGDTAQGFPVDLHGTATDVLRRGADGRWRVVIDNPHGVA